MSLYYLKSLACKCILKHNLVVPNGVGSAKSGCLGLFVISHMTVVSQQNTALVPSSVNNHDNNVLVLSNCYNKYHRMDVL